MFRREKQQFIKVERAQRTSGYDGEKGSDGIEAVQRGTDASKANRRPGGEDCRKFGGLTGALRVAQAITGRRHAVEQGSGEGGRVQIDGGRLHGRARHLLLGPAMEALRSGNPMSAMHIQPGYRLAEVRGALRYPFPVRAISEFSWYLEHKSRRLSGDPLFTRKPRWRRARGREGRAPDGQARTKWGEGWGQVGLTGRTTSH